MPYCARCTNSRTCTACWVGYALLKGRCVPCQPGCEDCQANVRGCQRCDPFHVKNKRTGQCIPL